MSTTTSASVPTASEVIAHLPWKWRTQGAIFIIGGLGFMFDAWDVALNGFLIPLLSDYWELSVGQAAWIATANLIGMALGAFVWGGIADVIGRKKAFTLTLLVFSIFTVAGAFSPAFGWFILFRFLAGFGLGGCIPVDYALVGEFTPSRHRGRVLTAMDGWWPIGASLCAFVSAALLGVGDWRFIMLVMIVPALLTVAVRFGIPESPLYLASVGRYDEADAIIAKLVKRTGAEVTEWTHDTAVPDRSVPDAAAITSVNARLRAASGQLIQLWQHSAKTTLVSWSLFVSVLLVYYAALTWLPGILKKQGLADQAAFLVTGSMTAVGILGVVVSALIVERFGRKWVLGVSSILAAILLVGAAIFIEASGAELTWSAKAAIIGFGFVVQIAIPTLYTYVSELYPTRLRGSGFGWASAASRLATGIAPVVFGAFMWPVLGLTLTFALTGVLVVGAVILMGLLARETTGEELS
ncbi:MAG: MFS transporter [Brevibacterium aurantiacum]|uniref:MFS transporter n=1 Tax=Brevibacterium aurantiacum TaxID=273384 RepID=A0A2A3X0K8_BREAU|nr:MFS transporter [Brevibacterium aurantiacum]MDN5585203.1 MFS transporter [Brevibacterium sp.]PCC17198.1 MFS transporter [Brevibacterium aurantiacum]PCC48695.1 MFS transporter [Brevibacterium aurantiacum]PCC57169.1 MFS transporter [Brevibacterium aurantiacum]RCS89849.1 MFS transporter [Brevibacterium aurantiacum]